ncbi:MAG: NYN domain-containing protein [Clostridia bacterium]|nr:NYN domain-containing protein [Clostridia bacterium]
MVITLTGGRAHQKHTEGGDFRQATYRAVRQALMNAENILLEPWYEMHLVLPQECAGRAMTDINRMGGSFEPLTTEGDMAHITARVPVRLAHGYQREVTVYTKGRGSMSLNVSGYEKCPDQDRIVAETGYDPERDAENPADSVFCSHGAGVLVKWNEAEAHMHIKLDQAREVEEAQESKNHSAGNIGDEEELRAIFERTYGKRSERRIFDRAPSVTSEAQTETIIPVNTSKRPEYLLVDGYNVIYAWPELKSASDGELELGRKLLSDILDNYAPLTDAHIILVFDAYKVKNNPGKTEKYGNIEIVYTKEAQTADSYIEKLAYELTKLNRVRVATSDGLEQLIILGSGALRMTALELKNEIAASNAEVNAILTKLNPGKAGTNLGNLLNKAMDGGDKP